MAEENGKKEGQQQQQGQQQQEQGAQPKQIVITNSVTDALNGFLTKKSETLTKVAQMEIAKVEESRGASKKEEGKEEGQQQGAQQQKQEGQQQSQQKQEGAQGANKKEEGKQEGQQQQGQQKEEGEQSAFGLKKDNKKQEDIKIEKFEDLLPVVNKELGLSLKDNKEIGKLFEVTKGWRADSQKLKDTNEELDKMKGIFENLPENFIRGMQAYYDGKDWQKEVGNVPKFDFGKPVEKQNVKDLVSHFYPNKFKDEDFDAETPSEALQIAIDASKDKFVTEKTNRDNLRVTESTKASARVEAYNNSISGSVDNLKKSFPDIIPEAEADISGILKGGPAEMVKLFVDSKGNVRKEAAELLMFAKYGKTEMMRMMGAASHIAESRANEDILTRGADQPGQGKKGGGKQDSISDQTKSFLSEIAQFKNKKTF